MGCTARNIRPLEALKKRMVRIIHGAPASELLERLGAVLLKQVADEFRESRDPYGRPWAPVVRRRRRDRRARARRQARGLRARAAKPLIDTGRLRASPVVKAGVRRGTLRVALPVKYAEYHDQPDGGEHRLPRRQILPDPKQGLGPFWGAAIRKEARSVMRAALGMSRR